MVMTLYLMIILQKGLFKKMSRVLAGLYMILTWKGWDRSYIILTWKGWARSQYLRGRAGLGPR